MQVGAPKMVLAVPTFYLRSRDQGPPVRLIRTLLTGNGPEIEPERHSVQRHRYW